MTYLGVIINMLRVSLIRATGICLAMICTIVSCTKREEGADCSSREFHYYLPAESRDALADRSGRSDTFFNAVRGHIEICDQFMVSDYRYVVLLPLEQCPLGTVKQVYHGKQVSGNAFGYSAIHNAFDDSIACYFMGSFKFKGSDISDSSAHPFVGTVAINGKTYYGVSRMNARDDTSSYLLISRDDGILQCVRQGQVSCYRM